MIISSRTPEGDPNRCPICRHRCRLESSCIGRDAPCPHCGHLLFFPEEIGALPKAVKPKTIERAKRPQGRPTEREPTVQADRLIKRLIRRATPRLGVPRKGFVDQLATVKEPYQAERLLALLHEATSWRDLLALWRAELSRKSVEAGKRVS